MNQVFYVKEELSIDFQANFFNWPQVWTNDQNVSNKTSFSQSSLCLDPFLRDNKTFFFFLSLYMVLDTLLHVICTAIEKNILQ